MNDDVVLAVRGATKAVRLPSGEDLTLLRDVDLTLSRGESVAIRGRSGSGKTTLLRALGLFIPFDAGEHHLLGLDVRTAGDRRCSRLRAESIGFVFQDFRLLPNLTAAENVEYGCILAGMPRRRRKIAVRQAMERVGLSDRQQSRPGQLSGGEQQRVSIARALVKQPALVLADEPTGALDGNTAGVIIELLHEAVTDLGAALVLVTHDETVAGRCHRNTRLIEGTIAEETTETIPIPAGAA